MAPRARCRRCTGRPFGGTPVRRAAMTAAAVLVQLAVLVAIGVATPGAAPAAPAGPAATTTTTTSVGAAEPDVPAGPSAAELDRQASTLAMDLDTAEADVATATTAKQQAEADLDAAARRLDRATLDEQAARDALSHYSVEAYVRGGRDSGEAMIDFANGPTEATTEAAAHRVLVLTVSDDLIERRRKAKDDADRAEAEYHAAQEALDTATARLDQTTQRRDELSGRLVSTQADAQQTREDEKREAERREALAKQAARGRLAGAGEGPPNTPNVYRSGIVPPPLAPSELAQLMAVDIPPTAIEAYWRAQQRLATEVPGCHIDWALVAGIGLAETHHGTYLGSHPNADGSVTPPIVGIALDGSAGLVEIRDTDGGRWDGDPVWDRAVGPMQFIPTTWRAFGRDGNSDGVSDPHNIYDAALATASYLCYSAGGDIRPPESTARAVRAYNNSDAYVSQVMSTATAYRERTAILGLIPGLVPTTKPGDASTTTTTTSVPGSTTTVPASTTTTSAPVTTTTTAPP